MCFLLTTDELCRKSTHAAMTHVSFTSINNAICYSCASPAITSQERSSKGIRATLIITKCNLVFCLEQKHV